MKKELLRKLRAEKFTLKQLADLVGISESQLSNIETGKREARVEELEKMAQELGVPAAIFLEDFQIAATDVSSGLESEKISRAIPVHGAAVMGEVCAKRWFEEGAEQFVSGDLFEVPVVPGRYSGQIQFAYKVSGNSMAGREIGHDDYVICAPYFEARDQIMPGDIVVIERKQGKLREVSCREVSTAGSRIEFASRPGRLAEDSVVAGRDLTEEGGEKISLIGLVIGKFRPIGI